MLHVQILTPRKKVREEDASSVSVPSATGELTILPKHAKLLTVLEDGIVTLRKPNKEEHLSIGGGYLETDGKELRILVSRAHGQHEIDEEQTRQALEEAKRAMAHAKDHFSLAQAAATVRRAVIDLKLLKKHTRRREPPPETQSM